MPFHLYLVTDRRRTAGRPLLQVVEQALQGGVDAVQLREKDLSARALYDLALALRQLCERYGARLLINDRIDVALAIGADGVHLPANSFTPPQARQLLGADRLIGVSTHSRLEAETAQAAGANFIVAGPLFDTPSKRAFGAPLGLDAFKDLSRAVQIPAIAIGGVRVDHVAALSAAGCAGVAVIGAILEAADPRAAAAELYAALAANRQR